jgi:hypothetical protein
MGKLGHDMTEKEKLRLWPAILIGAIVLLLVIGVLGIPSFRKYMAYKQATGVPRLRENIGKRVQIPQRSLIVLGETHTSGPDTGVLRYVGYRFNDKNGFFDCEVHLEAELPGDSSAHTGLSPDEVQQVKVIEVHQPPAATNAEDRAAQP